MAQFHLVRRTLAIAAGLGATLAAAALNVTQLVDGGQLLVSPMSGATLALALAIQRKQTHKTTDYYVNVKT